MIIYSSAKKHIVLFTPYRYPDDNIVVTFNKFIKKYPEYSFTYKHSDCPGSKTINILNKIITIDKYTCLCAYIFYNSRPVEIIIDNLYLLNDVKIIEKKLL